jgi:hypothetical protein
MPYTSSEIEGRKASSQASNLEIVEITAAILRMADQEKAKTDHIIGLGS